MKRIIPFVASMLFALSAQAQLINVNLTNGQTVTYNASQVDYIDFASAKQLNFTATVNNSTGTSIGDVKFTEGDQLLIKGENVSGVLPITSGAGTTSAVFTGTLNYTGEGNPASSLALTATLISSTKVGINPTTGAADYGTAFCSTVDEAVAKYCLLTGAGTYGTGEATFSLKPHTAFLNFTATARGPVGKSIEVTVGGLGSDRTATLTTVEGTSKPVVKFVVPVAEGTALSGITFKVGKFVASHSISSTATAKVYNIDKVMSVVPENIPAGVEWKQLWAGGPYFADRNIGATSVTGYGDYFAWGEVEPKTNYVGKTYEWLSVEQYHPNDRKFDYCKYSFADGETRGIWYEGDTFIGDGVTTLLPEDDAVYWNWGGDCRMPTASELQALIDNTDQEWATIDNVDGYKFMDKNDHSNYIFLPATGYRTQNYSDYVGLYGYCLSSSLGSTFSGYGSFLQFRNPEYISTKLLDVHEYYRTYGHTTRAVRTNL